MGGVVRKIKKTVKKITKPITKVVKKVVKKVKKIGKSVMKGVAKISNKLGPVGMIALSIAMPYALAGLSSMTTAAMSSGNVFLKAVGTIGNQIRLGYQAFNTGMSIAKKGITDVIGKTFQKFAPKGGTNIFSKISDGAKRLYTATKDKLKSAMPKPFTAKEGTVKFYDMDGVGTMTSTQAEAAIARGTLDPSMLGEQTLSGQGGWFTKTNAAGVQADTIVSDVINDAYKTRLDGFGTNAKRMFTDIKNKALEMDTYINDEQIGSFVESNKAASSYSNQIMEYAGDMDYYGASTGKYKITTEIPDLAQTGDYTLGTARDRAAGTYNFTGNETFGKQPATKNFFQKNAKKLKDLTKSILAPSGDAPQGQPADLPLNLDTSRINMAMSSYGGTDIEGSQGGSLVAKVYGQDAANRILTYHQNMNALNSGESYYTS